MGLRDLKLPEDLKDLAPMLTDSFQYPENPEWGMGDDERESFVEDIKNIARSWWMIRIGQVFIPAMRELLPGKIWEEDGQIIGVTLYQKRGSSDHWMVNTVATHPDYRRRGIARKLVSAGLEYIRAKKGEIAVLDVIDANFPAYKLYESLGFEHFTGNLDLIFTPDGIFPAPEMPAAYVLEKMDRFDWKPRFAVMKRISPENITKYEPVSESRFRQPGYYRLIVPLFARAQKVQEHYYLVRRIADGEAVGYLNYDIRTGGKGRHTITIRLDPEAGEAAQPLLAFALHALTAFDPNLMIEMGLPAWQEHVAKAAYGLGFKKRLLYHRMGVRLK